MTTLLTLFAAGVPTILLPCILPLVDGKPAKQLSVDRHDLYNLFTGPYGQHEIALKIRGKSLAAYAFTFGV